MFSSVYCAYRGSNSSFQRSKEDFEEMNLKVAEVFHLLEFMDEEDDDGATNAKYKSQVEAICTHYESLTPSRANISLDPKIFQGQIIRNKIGERKWSETTQKDSLREKVEVRVCCNHKIVQVVNGGHFEKRWVKRELGERILATVQTLFLLGVGGWNPNKEIEEWVADKKDEIFRENREVTINITYVERRMVTTYYRKEVYKVWKLLDTGHKIFMGCECSMPKKLGEEEEDNVTIENLSVLFVSFLKYFDLQINIPRIESGLEQNDSEN